MEAFFPLVVGGRCVACVFFVLNLSGVVALCLLAFSTMKNSCLFLLSPPFSWAIIFYFEAEKIMTHNLSLAKL